MDGRRTSWSLFPNVLNGSGIDYYPCTTEDSTVVESFLVSKSNG